MEKELEFDLAAFGVIGLETALPLVLALVKKGRVSLERAIEALTAAPARIFDLPGGSLVEGGPGDVTVIDPGRRWVCEPEKLLSKSANTPFAGWDVVGRVVRTLVDGRTVWALG